MLKFLTWDVALFNENSGSELGQRLGISYLRTLQEEVAIQIEDKIINIEQSSLGMMAISNVVWDCGLFLVDYLVTLTRVHNEDKSSTKLGRVLELGCGTGVVGIAALVLGADSILFSDIASAHCLDDNLNQLGSELIEKSAYISHDWNNTDIPVELSEPYWDTLLCSDVLYDEKNHKPLMSLLQKLRFKRMILAYKRRHDVPEREFFESLSQWCDLKVVDPSCVTLCNVSQTVLSGLHIIVVTPNKC